ncbi:MAG: invasion associated locus B family protein [Rhodoplanes sp.]
MMTTLIHWRVGSACGVLLAAAFGFSGQSSAIELAQAQKPARSAAVSGDSPQLLGQFGDWGAYTASPGGRKVCFALAKPASAKTDPPNRPRDPMYVFISSRPADNVQNEVSVMFGYQFKPNAEASLDVGGSSFLMYTQSDGGWVKNAAEEPRLVEAMRKAGDMTVKGVSSRGTATTDVYSLKGLSQALDRVAQECR